MKFTVKNTDKTSKFITIMKNMKSLVPEVNMHIVSSGIFIQGLDSSNVGLFELKLDKGWFDGWKGKDEMEYIIGLNCEVLSLIMNCYTTGQYIEFSYMENSSDELIIKFEGENHHDKMFEVKLMDIDQQLLEIPSTEYDADITMKSSEFNTLMAEASLFGDTLRVELGSDENIYMNIEGDNGVMRIRIKEENIVEYALAEEVEIKHAYALKYCLLYSKFSKMNKNVRLHLKDNTPLRIVYNLGHWIDGSDVSGNLYDDVDADEEELRNYLSFHLAPKIDEDEE